MSLMKTYRRIRIDERLNRSEEYVKATLEFNCDNPDEREELDKMLEAGDVRVGLFDFEQALRSIYKHEEHSDEVDAMVERIRGLFYDSLGEYL